MPSFRGEKSGDRPIKHQNREKPKKPRENQKNQSPEGKVAWDILSKPLFFLVILFFFGYFGFLEVFLVFGF